MSNSYYLIEVYEVFKYARRHDQNSVGGWVD
jgi:hypothetical protein